MSGSALTTALSRCQIKRNMPSGMRNGCQVTRMQRFRGGKMNPALQIALAGQSYSASLTTSHIRVRRAAQIRSSVSMRMFLRPRSMAE